MAKCTPFPGCTPEQIGGLLYADFSSPGQNLSHLTSLIFPKFIFFAYRLLNNNYRLLI
jgi:hypothetical protein